MTKEEEEEEESQSPPPQPPSSLQSSSSSSSVRVVVEQIIRELIHHYSQPIHCHNDDDEYLQQMRLCDDKKEKRDCCSTTTTMFPPMILAWRDRILQEVDYYSSDGCCCCCDDDGGDDDNDTSATIIRKRRRMRAKQLPKLQQLLLSTYVQQISPLLVVQQHIQGRRCCRSTKMSSSSSSISIVLVHYELLLQSLRQYHHQQEQQQSNMPLLSSTTAAGGSKSFSNAASTVESIVSQEQLSQQPPLTTTTRTTCGCSGGDDTSTTSCPTVAVVDDPSHTPHPQHQQPSRRCCHYKTTFTTTTMHNVVSTLLTDIVALQQQQQQHQMMENPTTTTSRKQQQQQDDSFDSGGSTTMMLKLEVVLWRILYMTLDDEVANTSTQQSPELPMPTTTTTPNNSTSSAVVVNNNMEKEEPELNVDDNVDKDEIALAFAAILRKCICVLLGTTSTTNTSSLRQQHDKNDNPTSSLSSASSSPQPRGYCDIDPTIVSALLDLSQYHPFHPFFNVNNESTITSTTTPETLSDTSAIMASSASQLTMPRRLLEWVDLEPPSSTIMSTESTTTPAGNATPPFSSSSSPNIQHRSYIRRARVVNSIWSVLLRLAHTYGISNIPAIVTSTSQLHLDDMSPASTTQQQRQKLCQVLNALGWAECAKCIRMYFFDYNNEAATTKIVKTRQRLHLGRTITEPKSNLTSVPSYQANPHRLWAALEFVSLLPYIDASVMGDLLPIVYELLNSPHDEYIRWGAIMLYRLLQCSKGNCETISDVSSHQECAHTWWRSETGMIAFDNLSCMLHQVIQTCRMGPTLAVLGAAQRALLLEQRRRQQQQQQLDPTTPTNRTSSSFLAKALHQWLLILDRNSRHYTKNHLVWGLLYGGIVPLLYDATVILQNNGDDSCVELGRLGLSALLSILRSDASYDDGCIDVFTNPNDGTLHSTISTDESKRKSFHLYFAVQVAALTALSSLLVAAHPIMPRHAGKILCELIAYMQNAKRRGNADQLESHWVILHTLALHAAAVSLIICGDTAVVNLDRLLHCTTDYEDCIANSVLEIRHIALQITS